MKAKITERFVLTYKGERLTFEKDAIVEGWPATRAIAARKAVPLPPVAAPENKAVQPAEVK